MMNTDFQQSNFSTTRIVHGLMRAALYRSIRAQAFRHPTVYSRPLLLISLRQ